jgi:TolB protein
LFSRRVCRRRQEWADRFHLAEPPFWEPDDDEALYTVRSPDAPLQLWVMYANGTNQHRLLDDPFHGNIAGSFSPDEQNVIFSRCDMHGACGIYRVAIDGNGLTVITGLRPGIADSFPVYSPHGLTIAFERRGHDDASTTFLMNGDGSYLRPLTRVRGVTRYPSWSPDGSRIAFNCDCDRSGRLGIWLIDRLGGGPTRVSNARSIETGRAAVDQLFPSWSPDGKFLAFEQRAVGVDPEVVVVDISQADLAVEGLIA